MAAFQHLLCKHGFPPQGWPSDDGLAIFGNGLIAASEGNFDAASCHVDVAAPATLLLQSMPSLAFRRVMGGFIDIEGSEWRAGWILPSVVNRSPDRLSFKDADIAAVKLYSEV